MGKLAKLLQYNFAGNSEKSRLLSDPHFKHDIEKTWCYWNDDLEKAKRDLNFKPERINGYKALLQSEATAINDSTLVQEEVFGQIIAGAQPLICFREAIPIVTGDSYQTRFIKGQAGTYADEVSEAGAIPIDTEDFTKLDVKIKKYGTRPLITQELIDDCLFSIVEEELSWAGRKMENTLNRKCLEAFLITTGSLITTNTLNPTGTHISVSDIPLMNAKIKKANFQPNVMILHPTAEGYLLTDSNLAYASYRGNQGMLDSGKVSGFMGLTPFVCTATDRATAPLWDDTTAGSDVTCMIFDAQRFARIVMKKDLTINQYEDPIHDLVGISCTMRYGITTINENAGGIIYSK